MRRTFIYSGTSEHPVYADRIASSSAGGRLPIVMIHGGFHNGSAFLATPDGRAGWADHFAVRGHDVYVADWPSHGRSPGRTDLTQLSTSDVARALGVLVSEVGPAIVMAHSAGAPSAWWIAENHGGKVAAVVGIAPGGPANLLDTLPDDPLAIERLGNSRRAGHPIFAPADRPARVDNDFILRYWANSSRFPHGAFEAYARSIGPESPRILNERFNIGGAGLYLRDPQALERLPILVVTGDCDPRHPRETDGALADFLGADFLWLADEGISGNGHMLMIEDNSEQIARRIGVWLDAQSL